MPNTVEIVQTTSNVSIGDEIIYFNDPKSSSGICINARTYEGVNRREVLVVFSPTERFWLDDSEVTLKISEE